MHNVFFMDLMLLLFRSARQDFVRRSLFFCIRLAVHINDIEQDEYTM